MWMVFEQDQRCVNDPYALGHGIGSAFCSLADAFIIWKRMGLITSF